MSKFPLSARLSSPRHYRGVFDAPRIRVSTTSFLVLAIPSSSTASRLGIVVAKKNIRKAHRRNRIKRIIREQFRLSRPSYPLDLVVLARASADQLTNAKAREDLKTLWVAIENKAEALCTY
jgi:ribonuclease P protein component